ncbi:DEAD/DEAH box helicase [Algoriphagus yeomjeoni]|uniref:DEAD/DEAH box helicase n=1 Tax=Algoriphagus yeomjeoni TaxID=291403 RepID=UPI003CE4D7B2
MQESIFQTYRNRLVDLSTKNRSLYLPKTEGFGVVDLKELDFLNGENSFEIIKKAISSNKQISLIPESDPRLADVNSISKAFSRLSFRDQLTQEETGEQSLYLGWPFVEGKLLNGQVLRAPLLLLGVKLKVHNEHWNLSKTDDWQWNPAFLLAYSHAYGKALDEEVLNLALRELSNDATEFRTELTKLLNEHFSLQLSSSIFEDQLVSFPISQSSLDSSLFHDGKLVLKSYALLGLFAQKGSFLFSDHEKLEIEFGEKTLDDLFTEHFTSGENQPVPREDQLFPVFPLDATQENVLVKVRQGKSLVVEGPPGTGKSQLIANLVSDYCSRGKKVLVVSQKRAALDVVFERLSNAGFGDFLGLVHDFRADQKELFHKIKGQIDSIDSYQEHNRGIDSIELEREISNYSKTISRLSEKFENLRTALFDVNTAGIPIKGMYLKASLKKSFFEHERLKKLDFQSAQEFERSFKLYHAYQSHIKGTFWQNRISFAHFEPAVFPRISQSLKEIADFNSKFKKEELAIDYAHLAKLILADSNLPQTLAKLNSSFLQLENPQLAISAALSEDFFDKLTTIQGWATGTIEQLNKFQYGISPLTEDLSVLELELNGLGSLVGTWFGRLQANFNKSKFPLVFSILASGNLKLNSVVLSDLQRELEGLKLLNQEFEKLPKIDGLELMELSIEGLQGILDEVNPTIEWVLGWRNQSDIHKLAKWNISELGTQIGELWAFSELFYTKSIQWKSYLSISQILDAYKNGIPEIGSELELNQTFSELVSFDRFLDSLDQITLDLAGKIAEEYSELSVLDQTSAFWNSWYLAWIAQLEAKTPVLAEAGSLTMQHELEELKFAVLEKRKIARHIALLRLREQVTSELDYNRLGNRLTYRDLLHQVCKKRQRWPIRKLVEEMGEEIFRLLPCWFASPETVSALFPLGQEFDLVIFDEASQCQVERGLPAMLRGKQVVVAGDSKQLRPSDFYQVKWDSDEEGLEYEAESLLELAGNFFEKHQLKGHYRSADPALIHFSNTHFYDDQLETLPDYATSMAAEPAFTWEKVQGIWASQVNKTEADAVVLKVESILSSSPTDTIGVVTGNYFQMELIREKLWTAGFQDSKIKVRNIENVQGDEFDQVILSLGYAPNPEGKLVTNFGLLGKAGAENRLNVAITRSRKKMHVISSIEPSDFRPGQLKNPGLVLLREFLSFVQKHSKSALVLAPEPTSKGYEIDWSLKNILLDQNKFYSKETPSVVMDLVFDDSNGEMKAILTDDQRFFNSPTAKAAVAYHPILLEQKGWRFEWKWSRQLFVKRY